MDLHNFALHDQVKQWNLCCRVQGTIKQAELGKAASILLTLEVLPDAVKSGQKVGLLSICAGVIAQALCTWLGAQMTALQPQLVPLDSSGPCLLCACGPSWVWCALQALHAVKDHRV